MMEASKEGETPTEQAPETLPAEAKEEAPKSKMVLAAIIAVIIIVAAIGAAFGLGLFGKKEKEEVNLAPSGGARATTSTTISIGGSVTFESLATDSDGTIVDYKWYFGDGTVVNGSALSTVTHTYNYGGSYWVWHVVTDDKGATASNEASMIRVTVLYYQLPEDPEEWTNDTAPYAVLSSDKDVIQNNTAVKFNMTGTTAVGWNETAWNETGAGLEASPDYIASAVLDFGDGSAAVDVPPGEEMTMTKTFTSSGHFAVAFNVTDVTGDWTKVMRTIHVLTPQAPTPGVIKNPDAFVTATIGEPDYLDPAVDYETAGGEVLQNVYETLVWYDRDSAERLVPLLATEVPTLENGGISPDGLNYTFHLKTGVKFHDNATVMDADDVVYSIQRVLRIHDPDGPSWMLEEIMTDYLSYYVGDELQNYSTSAQWILDALGGTDPHYVITEQDVTNVSQAVVIKVDDYTVKFRLTHPAPAFLQICAYTVMAIVSKDYVEAHGGVVNGQHNDWMDKHAFGTGPYKFVDWEVGSKIHLQRFDGYHGAKPALKDVYIVKANDVNTRILMLQAGDADSIALPIEYESMFAGKPEYRIVKGLPTFDIMFAGFNMNINTTAAATWGSTVPSDFFQDVHVRRAFACLMNYTQFINNVLKGNAIHPNGPIPKGMFGYNASIPEYKQNLTMAEAEFKLAINPATGRSWWDDGFTVAFMYNAGNTVRETACQYMKQALESLNPKFHATVNALDWPTYLANLRKSPSPFPMFWLGWAPDYADPADYVTPFLHSTAGVFPYRTGYANPTIDALIDQANSELNATRRYQLYSEISMLCYEDVPYIWLYQAYNFHIERSWVRGYYFNPMYAGFYYAAFSKG